LNAHRPILHGVAFLAIAVGCFAALDTTTKVVSAAVPLLMTLWVRYVFQTVATAVALFPSQRARLFRTRRPLLQVVRGLMLLISSALAFLSLHFMPVGEFTAIVLLTPLLMTLLAATSLGERVSWLRWALLLGGFAGAMLVLRPGAMQFTWAAFLPLALVGTNAAYQLMTSVLAREEDIGTTQFYGGFVGAVVTSLLLPLAWQDVSGLLWSLLMLLGVFGTLGHYLLTLAYRHAPVAVLTPYLYLQIAFATIAGWLVFSHVPDRWSFIGIAVIGVCGAAGTWITAAELRRRALS
jgi:drug/metabolite transporter (DMT)-like permease